MQRNSLPEFADRMAEIMPVIIKEFAMRQAGELYKGKVTLPQFLILGFLQREGESKMTSLARFMRVSRAATTGIIDRLVRDGYVIRVYEPKDRRIVKIKLAPPGAELLKRVNHKRRRMIIKIFGHISAADRWHYLRILTQIKEILTKERAV